MVFAYNPNSFEFSSLLLLAFPFSNSFQNASSYLLDPLRAGSGIVTLTERKSRFTVVSKVKRRTSQAVRKQVCRMLLPVKNKVRTLTSDHGKEFADHEQIAQILELKFYFAHPYAPWERGTNENTNGLLRQYFPKKSDFRSVSKKELEQVMTRLNFRPRKTLRFKTPFEVFYHSVVALTS